MDDFEYPVNHPLSPHRQLFSPHKSPHRNTYKASPSERSSQPTATMRKMVLSPTTGNISTDPRTHKHETFRGSTQLVKILKGDQYMDELRNEAFWLDISVEELIERKKKELVAAKAESSTAGQKRKLRGEIEDQVNQQEEEEEVSFKRISVDIFFENTEHSASENKSQERKSEKGKERARSASGDESGVTEPPKKRRKNVSDNDVEKSDTKDAAEVNKNSISEGSRGAAQEEKKQEQKDQSTNQKKREREMDDEDEHGESSPPKKKYRNLLCEARHEVEENPKEEEEKARDEGEQEEISQRRSQSRNQETRDREEVRNEIVDVQLDADPSPRDWDDTDMDVPPGLFVFLCTRTAKLNPRTWW